MLKTTHFKHDDPETFGILLVNLGTPDSPSKRDVRRYLKEFLWDRRVVKMPRPIWWAILNLYILQTRPQRSAEAYKKVWTEQGSPLLHISKLQRDALQTELHQRMPSAVKVVLAMRYGNPGIAHGMNQLKKANVRKVLVLPLYPQYSATTTASTFDAIAKALIKWNALPEFRFINNYHDSPHYIQALTTTVNNFWSRVGVPEKLIMSFHGLPKVYLNQGDPYFCQCHKTARLLAKSLKLPDDRWEMTFQSRLGPKKWLQPYTDKKLIELAKQGTKNVQVICPGFSADCLETLEEIAIENRDFFMAAGGEQYDYIPCLNDQSVHINALADIIDSHVKGWIPEQPESGEELQLRKRRAGKLGAKF